MSNNIFKGSLVLVILFLLSGCGFKPLYKLSDDSIDIRSYSIVVINKESVSREIKEEIKKLFPKNGSENNYIIEINAIENLDPLITNTDGTISKYRIEILLYFKIKDKNTNTYLLEDMVRGFAQYTVETSEIESNKKRQAMLRTASNNAIQMMISKIQSQISVANDN
tara:strand:- start:22 stop:522 length:501 start_codon:yes stop_codon:yes gene_type:complete